MFTAMNISSISHCSRQIRWQQSSSICRTIENTNSVTDIYHRNSEFIDIYH